MIQRLLLPVEQWVPYPGQTDHLPQRGGRGENEHLLGVDLPGATGYSIPTMTFNPSCVWARKKSTEGSCDLPKVRQLAYHKAEIKIRFVCLQNLSFRSPQQPF